MNRLPIDMYLETFRHTRDEDLPALCRSNAIFTRICQSPEGQARIERLREIKVDKFIDHSYGISAFLTDIENLSHEYQRIYEDIFEEVEQEYKNKYLNLFTHVADFYTKYINQIEKETIHRFLLENYQLLPYFQKRLVEISSWYSK